MRRCIHELLTDSRGAIAPTLALSLVALIAAGGIAFDYARMASLDTELQNAADQAALAAASQLDGQPGACARAAAAARNLIANRTLMANETGGTRAITIANEPACDAVGNIRFYQEIDRDPAATLDENAKFVEVTVDPREAFFAFTPIVAALRSGSLAATAYASLGEAICRVPPLMMCNPDENGDPDFTVGNYVGRGMRLIANDGGGNYGPGNFGFLDVGQGANDLRAILGRNGDPGNCASGSTVTTEPGNMVTLRDAMNTRFDMYHNSLNQVCGANGDLCAPSLNTRKDLLRVGTGNNSCGEAPVTGGGNGWKEPDNNYPNIYLNPGNPTASPPVPPEAPRDLTDAEIATLAPMGYPRDKCHAFTKTGACPMGIIGDGAWDRFAYFKNRSAGANAEWPEVAAWQKADSAAFNDWLETTFGSETPSRYTVYLTEMADPTNRLKSQTTPNGVSHGQPICNPPGVTPSTSQIDRRILSVAVINCEAEGIQGKTPDVQVTKYIDVFLVEPSVPRERTEIHDVYVEVVGLSANAAQSNVQIVKKAVPYLIE